MTDNATTPDKSWYGKAGCRGLPSNLFFLDCEKHEYGEYKRKLLHTQSICSTCEVIKECFNQALINDEVYGVWGGVDFQQRGKVNRSRANRLKSYVAQHETLLRNRNKKRKVS